MLHILRIIFLTYFSALKIMHLAITTCVANITTRLLGKTTKAEILYSYTAQRLVWKNHFQNKHSFNKYAVLIINLLPYIMGLTVACCLLAELVLVGMFISIIIKYNILHDIYYLIIIFLYVAITTIETVWYSHAIRAGYRDSVLPQ